MDQKRPRLAASESTSTNLSEGQKFIERFNQDMMEQFLEHQRRVQSSYQRWELERQRQHEQSMERWRQEARDHEKQMFGMFVQVIGECNAALNNMLKINKVKETIEDDKDGKDQEGNK